MFCQKCHTQILDDSIKFCHRCGTELNRKKTKFSSFQSDNTFKYMSKYGKKTSLDKFNYENLNTNTTIDEQQEIPCNINENAQANNHSDQFNYSLNYSGVTKKRQTHDEQFNYSKNYSGATKKSQSHDDQYNYSQFYSNATNSQQAKAYQEKQRIQARYNAAAQNAQQAYQNNQQMYQQQKYDVTNREERQQLIQAAREEYYRKHGQQQTVTSDDTYRLTFMGTNQQAIIKNHFSVPTLLFGPLHLIYRKMFGLGIATQILIFVLASAFGEDAAGFQFMINLFLAFNFRTMYLRFTDKKVNEIKVQNPDKSSTELLNICRKKGNTIELKNFIILFIVLYIIFDMMIGLSSIEPEPKNDPLDDFYNQIENNNDYNNGYVTNKNNKVYVFGDYKFETSHNLSLMTSSETNYLYKYNKSNTEVCTFYLDKIYSHDTARNFLTLQEQNFRNYTPSYITAEQLNNINWYKQRFNYPDGRYPEYMSMYAMKDNYTNNIYTITTFTNGSTYCNTITREIVNSFRKKN